MPDLISRLGDHHGDAAVAVDDPLDHRPSIRKRTTTPTSATSSTSSINAD
ncbi:hypothetical protein [Amycolatopsis jiangsuensis]|uniref:Uncharacterized protein n=1 Tax=Amycolatopsis jiangsuensis TaxID=1181879 RepID=A0A840IS82_9PSEU|nr:hypothetical protein [Amycolatopsis jiangsuensis]MBB4684305.1 hypothetical protein [Amycolatopsis jiangsuensis]